jgi:hypothetical protein
MVIAADHTSRGIVGAGRRPAAMADRADVLDRVCLALSRPGVTGVLGSPDILADLLLLGALDGKAVFGTMNRGGLQGAAREVDDRFTARLKVPVVEDMDRVVAATTLPTVLLGGEVSDDQAATFARWERALRAPGAIGLVVGRSLLYPPDDDVAAVVDAAVALLPSRATATA